MKTRIITAVIAVAVFIPFLIFSDTYAFVAACTVLSVISAYEMLKCMGFHKNFTVSAPTYLISAAIPALSRLISHEKYIAVCAAVMFIYVFLMFSASVFSKGNVPINDSCLTGIFVIYATLGFSSLLWLRDLPYGKYIYLLSFICPWLCDTFAYFGGRLWGKHKLIPDVSPNKTKEGAVSGILFGTAGVLLYAFIISKTADISVNYLGLATLGIVITLVSQIGDLSASVVKRYRNIKDYGNLFPGHGGVLDRFDSVIASSVFIFIFCVLTKDIFTLFG